LIIHAIDAASPPELQRALAEFESAFLIPFAPGRSYRIDYGGDRSAFIRTLGEGKCLAAENEGRIVGVLEMAAVNLFHPDGIARTAIYFADVKLLPEARRGITAGRILQKGAEWSRTKSNFWFTVALAGMPLKPPDYSGRAGIPAFSAVGALTVVRLPVTAGGDARREPEQFLSSPTEGEETYSRLARGRYGMLGGAPDARSAEPPIWMVHPGGRACARFEDRRNVRRLIADDCTELRPAYLSRFVFQDPGAAVDLIVAALGRAESLRYRALRFCLPPGDLAALQCVLGPGVIQGSEGTVFSNATTDPGAPWSLNASEI